MSSKVHHNTAKKAKKFGVELVSVENEFEARKDGKTLAMHASASVALDKAIEKLNGAAVPKAAKPAKAKSPRKPRVEDFDEDVDTDGEGDDDREEDIEDNGEDLEGDSEDGRSVVKRKYKQTYKGRPLKISCSDDLAVQLAKHLKVKDEDGKWRIDGAKLKAFARANDVWDPKYASLNPGMQRMNVVNRLRAKIRRDKHKVVWG